MKPVSLLRAFKILGAPTQPVFTCSKSTIIIVEHYEICSKLTTKTPERRQCLYC